MNLTFIVPICPDVQVNGTVEVLNDAADDVFDMEGR